MRWEETVRGSQRSGATLALEMGPGRVLTGLLRRTVASLTGSRPAMRTGSPVLASSARERRAAMSGVLQGQVALVTGGSRGSAGRSHCACGDGAESGPQLPRKRAAAEEEVQLVQAANGVATRLASTSPTRKWARAGVQSIVDRAGRLDILVNNAGTTADALVLRLKEEEWSGRCGQPDGCISLYEGGAPGNDPRRYGPIVNLTSSWPDMGQCGPGRLRRRQGGPVG